jgi:hypothetical protein
VGEWRKGPALAAIPRYDMVERPGLKGSQTGQVKF